MYIILKTQEEVNISYKYYYEGFYKQNITQEVSHRLGVCSIGRINNSVY